MPVANANSAAEVVVGANGQVYAAPVGTTAPADMSASFSASWLNLGYVSEDGITFDPTMDLNSIMVYQSAFPIRRDVTTRSATLSFTLMQWSKTTIPFAWGGGAVATSGTGATEIHTYTPDALGTAPDYRAVAIAWSDGTKDYRLFIPKGIITDLGEFNLTREDAAGLPVTFEALGQSGVNPFYFYTDDPAFATS